MATDDIKRGTREWYANLENAHRATPGMTRRQMAALDHNIKRYKDTGEICYMGMCPSRPCFDPDAGFNSRYGDGKTAYICAICGRRFGQTTVLSYYLPLMAWAHNSCIARHCCGNQDACTLPPHERKEE